MTAAANLSGAAPATPRKWQLWTGRVLSALPVLMLLMSASMKLTHQRPFVEQFVGKLGYPEGVLTGIGLVELASVVLYVIPQTAILGALLLTGYLGGAIATHVRIGEPFVAPLLLGVIVWAGVFLRDSRVRELLPIRKPRA